MPTILLEASRKREEKILGYDVFIKDYKSCVSVSVSVARKTPRGESSCSKFFVINGKERWNRLAYLIIGICSGGVQVFVRGDMPSSFRDTLYALSNGALIKEEDAIEVNP